MAACSVPDIPPAHSFSSSNIESIIRKPKNVVFIWTTWCSASKDVLENTYQFLQVDTSEVSVSILCGNNDLEEVRNIYKKYHLKYDTLILSDASNFAALLDRRNIKSFIQTSFDQSQLVNLEGNFGLPVTLLVDENKVVIQGRMPQDTASIMQILRETPR